MNKKIYDKEGYELDEEGFRISDYTYYCIENLTKKEIATLKIAIMDYGLVVEENNTTDNMDKSDELLIRGTHNNIESFRKDIGLYDFEVLDIMQCKDEQMQDKLLYG